MTEHILKLSPAQLHEVYSTMWREFVNLHKQVTINPHGMHKAVIKRVRLSRADTAQVCDMIEAMQPDFATTDERYLAARAQAKIEADHGVIFATTRHGSSFVMLESPSDGTPHDLSKIAPLAFPVPTSFGSRPSNKVLEVAELAIGLHGKEFAMLTEDELKRFQLLREIGGEYGVTISVAVLDASDQVQAELAAASPAHQEEIYRRLLTEITVDWFAIDGQEQA